MTQQLGFDLEYTDPFTSKLVPWATPSKELIARISAAPWKVVDTETTGLNPASKEQSFTGRALRRGINPRLRLRIVSVLYPTPSGYPCASPYQVEAFDLDTLSQVDATAVCSACFNNVVIAHNAGFDAYWIRQHTKEKPTLLLDSMLIARVLYPEQPVMLAKMCHYEDYPDLKAEAEKVFMAGASGWSLAHLVLTRLQRVLPKDKQGPKNWCEPFLSQAAYNYATNDVIVLFELILNLFEIEDSPSQFLERYYELRDQHIGLRIIEPQVWDIIVMRETGMPWSVEEAHVYGQTQFQMVHSFTDRLIALEPQLEPFRHLLSNPSSGVSADLKQAIGEAFTSRGLSLQMTLKTGAFKIGEKDLRRVMAALTPDAKELFEVWVGLNKAKKTLGMAEDFTGYALRSKDGRIHPNIGHGPLTGRLSCSEPNCQQCPRDQGFRNCVRARKNFKITSSDYSALDMRVGAALAIRAQHQILEAYLGDKAVPVDVLRCITRVYEGTVTLEAARTLEATANVRFEQWKSRRDEVSSHSKYWEKYRELQRIRLLSGFQRCLAEVKSKADKAGTSDWGSLRDAFAIEGMDIHTWTALDMMGHNPKELFDGLSGPEVVSALNSWKKELGDMRQTGKVGNLSLLYAMQPAGLQEAAAKNYNIHWTLEEATSVRNKWLAAYVEIDLWHKWTELNQEGTVLVPDPDRGNKLSRKAVYASYTLGGRLIYAFGLNAALSYEDQSTGADILGRVMAEFRKYPEIQATIINQVHDELLFEIPEEHVEEYSKIIGEVMTEAAEFFLMPFGVKATCEPETGDVWLKG